MGLPTIRLKLVGIFGTQLGHSGVFAPLSGKVTPRSIFRAIFLVFDIGKLETPLQWLGHIS